MVIPNLMYAKVASVLITALTLFVVGYIPTKKVFAGFRMAFVAGFAILIGYAIGNLY